MTRPLLPFDESDCEATDMRIIRNDDHNDEDPEDFPRDDLTLQGEIFAEQVEDFVAAAADTAPQEPIPLDQDTPAEPESGKPALRLIINDDIPDPPTAPDPDAGVGGPGRGARPRAVRAGATGSAVVVAVAVLAGWGESLIVVGPIAVYGLGWIAYLWWNAALRPPIPQAFAAVTTGLSRTIAALLRGLLTAIRRGVERLSAVRDRHENHRTAPTT